MAAEIGFIGLGNMARAMISGMLKQGLFKPEQIIGSAKTAATEERVAGEYGIGVRRADREVAAESGTLVLAVKPQFMAEVIDEIKDAARPDQLIISIAAGKTFDWLAGAFGRELKFVRCMPNTPAMVGEGCTAVCVNDLVTDEEAAYCIKLMESFGRAGLIDERLADIAGAVGGCSPAYAFMFAEAMADGAVLSGMPRAQAYEFAAQAMLGSAKLMLETGRHPGELKDMVCSPGGTTIEGLKALEERGFRGAVIDAISACMAKYEKL